MKYVLSLRFLCLISIVCVPLLPAICQKSSAWSGKRIDGTEISENELNLVLQEHKKWIDKNWEEFNAKQGNRLLLRGADLAYADLKEANLRGADLYSADLKQANLSGADLRQANLRKARLNFANLSKSDLREADLSGAKLIHADLRKAKTRGIKLERAILIKTKIDDSFAKNIKWQTVWDLINKNEVNENEADNAAGRKQLMGIDLSDAYLIGVDISGTDKKKAKLSKINLRGAELNGANLSNTDLSKANLSDASLIKTNLRGADLSNAIMSNANLTEVDLAGVIFEPKAGSLPEIQEISTAHNLSKMQYKESPHALVALREAFKRAGLLTQERELTYAIKYSRREALWKQKGVWGKLESLFNLIFFELTCQYGMKPGRPLMIMLVLICILTIPYTVALMWPPQKDGIWQIWFPDRVRKHLGSDDPIRLRLVFFKALKSGFFFSVLSAFSIGWREINVRNWIIRLQRQEYIFRATGWVRTLSGLQSLISVYLLALWVLTYFGHLFETV